MEDHGTEMVMKS